MMTNKQRELLFSITKKDLRIDAFYAGGSGGQNQNKRKTGCRVTHPESGSVGEGRDSRSFDDNKRNAFLRMIKDKKFQEWMKYKTAMYGGNELQVESDPVREVIRTYNYHRNIVTDHRTGKKYELNEFLNGFR